MPVVMQQMCASVVGVVLIAVGCDASSFRHDQAPLKASDAKLQDAPWKSTMQASISVFVAPPQPPPEPGQVAMAHNDKGDKGDEKSNKAEHVQVQVEETVMKNFMDALSEKCAHRFTAILQGKGPQLHTFGSPEVSATEASCAKLNGTLCATKAHVIQKSEGTPSGRVMESHVDVAGDGCLPKECMGKNDLGLLANFMHTRAKETAPGAGMKMSLHVDCSKLGGSTATVDDTTAPTPRSAAATTRSLIAVICFVSSLAF